LAYFSLNHRVHIHVLYDNGIEFYIIFSFNIQTDTPQNVYKQSMNGWYEAVTSTGVEVNCKTATQGASSRPNAGLYAHKAW